MGPESPNHLPAVVQNLAKDPPQPINRSKNLDGRLVAAQDWRVLHIEDDDGDAYLVLRALRQAAIPAKVYRCLDSEEGLLFLRQNRSDEARWPDVVLLDLNTPRMNGWEFLTSINADEVLSELPVVIVTSSSLPEDRERALALGARDFQTKPDHFDELIHIMERIFTAPLKEQPGSLSRDPGLTAVLA